MNIPRWGSFVCFPNGEALHPFMNVFHRSTLAGYWDAHPESKQPLMAWLASAKGNRWASMNDVVATYSKASPVNAERCVFNIRGHNDRLIAAFHFRSQSVYIKFIGTHTEYDRVDAATVGDF